MSFRTPPNALVWWTVALLALAASCSSGTSTDGSGALNVQLELEGGVEIDEVRYTVSGNGMEPMSGSIDVSAPDTTVSVELFGIPEGTDYLIEMTATSVDGGTTCNGATEFDISPGQVTLAYIVLNCRLPDDEGGVNVNGEFNICAQLQKAVVSPLQGSISFMEIQVLGLTPQANQMSPLRGYWSNTREKTTPEPTPVIPTERSERRDLRKRGGMAFK